MTFAQRAERAFVSAGIKKLIRYVKRDPDRNLSKTVNFAEKFVGRIFPQGNFEKMRNAANDKDNVWRDFALKILNETDENVILKMALSFGLGAGVHGTREVRKNRDKHHCNIPWLILMDPTSACNKKCKGCWSAEYGSKSCLTFEEMDSIVCQGKALGTHLYMFTGGEPLIKKDEIIALCKKHQDCLFLSFTNATLIDQEFCDEVKKVGNFALMLSIEGDSETTDSRRGSGSYQSTIDAMKLLKKITSSSVCPSAIRVKTSTL